MSTEVQEVEPILLSCLTVPYLQDLPLHVLPLDCFALSLQLLNVLWWALARAGWDLCRQEWP